jgi:aminodeoxychorismate synthase component I
MPTAAATPVDWDAQPLTGVSADAIRRAMLGRRDVSVLESHGPASTYCKYNIYAFHAQSVTLSRDDGKDPFSVLESAVRKRPWKGDPPPVPFVGGWVGWLSYEAGQFVEPIRRRHERCRSMPVARWVACDRALIHDRDREAWWIAACALGDGDPTSPGAKAAALREWISHAADTAAPPATDAAGSRAFHVGPLIANMTRDEYVHRVERALEYIRAGDIYQVNLAQRFSADWSGDPAVLYDRLCQTNPAMFAAYMGWDHGEAGIARSAVLSSSPELFLDVRGRRVVTRPIKGTRARLAENTPEAAAQNAAARLDLETSEKERAELVMIVDLERNDLGRVCEYGSVKVTCAAETETHPTVFHRVATVEGTLRRECGPIDVLRAAFPCGSITGAPKVRAMQIIDELEPDPRGPYCGAVGYIGIDGAMTLNVAIRTMWITDARVHIYAGGGIVADSDPQAEYEETLAKAEGMRRALQEPVM